MANLAGVVQQLKKERDQAARALKCLDAALAALNGEAAKPKAEAAGLGLDGAIAEVGREDAAAKTAWAHSRRGPRHAAADPVMDIEAAAV